jgi:hypothetical protein
MLCTALNWIARHPEEFLAFSTDGANHADKPYRGEE